MTARLLGGDREVARSSVGERRRSRSARFGVIALLVSLALLAVAAAPASADWSRSFSVSKVVGDATYGESPEIAARPDGSFVAVWTHRLDGAGNPTVIEGRTIGATGKLGPILRLSGEVGDVRHVRVAVGANGDALVTWKRIASQLLVPLEGRWIDSSGKPGPIFTVSAPDAQALQTFATVDQWGTATVVWTHQVTHGSLPQAVIQTRQVDAAGPIGSVQTLTKISDGGATFLTAAVGPDLRAFVFYSQEGRLRYQRLGLDGASEGAATQLSAQPDTVGSLNAATDAQGRTRVMWDGAAAATKRQIFTRTIGPDGSLTPVETLPTEQEPYGPVMALGDTGAAAIVSQDLPKDLQDPTVVRGATILADGTYGARLPLSDPTADGPRPEVGIDANGFATAVWQRGVGDNYIVESARFSSAGAESKITELSVPGDDTPAPAVAVAKDGTVVATWWEGTGDEEHLRVKGATFTPGGVGATPIPVPPSPLSPPPEQPEKCHGKKATIVGTSYGDEIPGTKGDDVIVGGRGSDEVRGSGGDDLICGDGGDDALRGGAGKDELVGGPGKDVRIPG